ncbi:transposase [Mesorhizobium sp. M0700]|uniref:transposase n=1 Tax=Mesorhizobium sp. M0700 TaxID=2956988 RepID=UPI00333AFF99
MPEKIGDLVDRAPLPDELVNKSADERIARLTAVVKMLERSRFGSRSERLRTGALSEEQYALVFDEAETGVAAIEAQMEKSAGGSKAKRAPRHRKGFAAHLERIRFGYRARNACWLRSA